MPTITKIDKQSLKQLESTVLAALNQLNCGVTFKFGGGRFSTPAGTATLKLEIFLPQEDGVSQEAACFKALAPLYGFSENDLGKIVTLNGQSFTLTGMRRCRSKYAFYVTRVKDGKRVLTTLECLRTGLAGVPNSTAV